MKRNINAILLVSAASILSACSSVSLPSVDFLKGAGTSADEAKAKNYPKVADAPQAPTDLRSAAAWDKAANTLIDAREGFETPDLASAEKTEAEIAQEFADLKAKVNAYKKDDPQ